MLSSYTEMGAKCLYNIIYLSNIHQTNEVLYASIFIDVVLTLPK